MDPVASIVWLNGNRAPQIGCRLMVFSLVDESDREQEQAPRRIRAALEGLVEGASSVVVTTFEVVTDRHAIVRFSPPRRMAGRAAEEFERLILVPLKLPYSGGQ